MKKTMKFLSMAALALVGAAFTGCSSDNDGVVSAPQQPAANTGNVEILTTTVSLDGDDATRALDASGHKTFAVGETMAVIYSNGTSMVKAVSHALEAGDITNEGKNATFTFDLETPSKSGDVLYIYPAAMAGDTGVDITKLNTQEGTFDALQSKYDLCTNFGAWDGDNLPSLTLQNQLAILAITLKDANGTSDLTAATTKLTLSDGTNTYNVNRSAAEGPIYVAIFPTVSANIDITATCGGNGYYKSLSAKTFAAGNGYTVGWKRETNVQLSKLKGDYTAQNGDVLAGTLAGDYAISIASGASVTLSDVTINRGNSRKLPGIQCNGNATITLVGSNTVNASTNGDPSTGDYAGIQVGPSGTTLTIQGEDDGSLSATGQYSSAGIGGSYAVGNAGNIIIASGAINATGGNDGAGIGSADRYSFGTITISGGVVTAVGHGNYANAAGIGTGYCGTCDDITISGGTVTATGDEKAAGIGCGGDVSECGNILISGGTVTATGGSDAAGIGSGYADEACTNSCGDITITSGVTHVTATKGESNEDNSTEPESIGAGGHLNSGWDEDLGDSVEAGESTCGTVTIDDPSKVTQN